MFALVSCLFIVLNSCNSCREKTGNKLLAKDTIDINEGVITYAVSYPNLKESRLSPFLPNEISFVFKGNLSSYIIRSGLGTINIVRLLDYDKQEFISLLIDIWGTNFACKETSEDIMKKETSAIYEYKFIGDAKAYDGLTCKKAVVKNINDNTEFEIYYAPNISINNWSSPYKDLNKLLIDYPFSENGMDMLLKATKIESKEIDSSFFTVKGDFEWITATQFNNHLQSFRK
ncbi:MAG: hypothetical protein JSV22_06700 [Bacteroidales bacterium]|nr:MAG: hypothetical protein JSV22_06700 [Bacteroidales bacterium]